jgi:hypothetical protein
MGPLILRAGEPRPLATLWKLTWDKSLLACVVYRTTHGLRLKIESSDAVILSEGFDLEPRELARARALRDALKRRGWQEPVAREKSER